MKLNMAPPANRVSFAQCEYYAHFGRTTVEPLWVWIEIKVDLGLATDGDTAGITIGF